MKSLEYIEEKLPKEVGLLAGDFVKDLFLKIVSQTSQIFLSLDLSNHAYDINNEDPSFNCVDGGGPELLEQADVQVEILVAWTGCRVVLIYEELLNVDEVFVEEGEGEERKVNIDGYVNEPVELDHEAGEDPGQNRKSWVVVVGIGHQNMEEATYPEADKWHLGFHKVRLRLLDELGNSNFLVGFLYVLESLSTDENKAEEQSMDYSLY